MRISDWSSDVCSSDLAPAETDVYHLHDIVADALISGSHATVSPTEVRLMSLREEAAMFNSNGDQWESDPEKPWDLRKGGEHILSVSVPFDHVARTLPMQPADAAGIDRQSVVKGKSVSVRVDLGGRRLITTKQTIKHKVVDEHE